MRRKIQVFFDSMEVQMEVLMKAHTRRMKQG